MQTGASLKLTILNPKGRIWTMVAGGGASVIYSDTVMKKNYNVGAHAVLLTIPTVCNSRSSFSGGIVIISWTIAAWNTVTVQNICA